MAMSFMGGKGLSTTQLVDLVVNTLYNKFLEKDVKEFDGFNVGILDTFNALNMAIPGKHYVAPSYKDVKDLFQQWKETNKENKKDMFTDFISENVHLNKADESMLITAIVAPPAAMMAKKTGKIVPQLALMNAIPDVVFVPSATLLALFATKIVRLTFVGKATSTPATEIEEPRNATEQESQTPTTSATPIDQELQVATEPEPETKTPIDQEPQVATEPEPETKTPIDQEPQVATEPEPETKTPIEQELQVATKQEPETKTPVEEVCQVATEQEPETKTPVEEERQVATEQEPETKTLVEEERQVATEQEPETETPVEEEPPLDPPQHIHKDNTFCFLCNTYH